VAGWRQQAPWRMGRRWRRRWRRPQERIPIARGLLPGTLGPQVVDASLFAGHAIRCLPGITDGRGHVAIGTANAIGSPDVIWTVKPRWGGAQVSSFSGAYIPELLSQRDGWIGGESWSPVGYVRGEMVPQRLGARRHAASQDRDDARIKKLGAEIGRLLAGGARQT